MQPIVNVTDLKKQYDPPDGIMAVNGISFAIAQGEIFSLLGPNGAGKTTTLSMLSCLLAATEGDAIVSGYSISKNPMQVKRAIGVVPQEIALYDTISARENLQFWGKLYGLKSEQLQARIDYVLEIAGLVDRAQDKVESYSGGMKRRLNIAVGLLHQPEVLYLDEPTVGIDPQSRRRILDTIKTLNEDGMTILYTTHYMEEAEELSTRIGIIDHGDLIALGTLQELTTSVGECDIIQIAVDYNGANKADVVERLRARSAIQEAGADDESVTLQVQDADTALSEVVAALNQCGVGIRRLEIQEPNLEAVFLQLTGRGLRD